jgi:hypothetical protein
MLATQEIAAIPEYAFLCPVADGKANKVVAQPKENTMNLDKMRKKQQEKTGVATTVAKDVLPPADGEAVAKALSSPKPAKPKGQPSPQKVKPPVVAVVQVQALCGHTVMFEHFADKADKFRAERRKKLTDKACGSCRQAANAEREAAERAARGVTAKPKKPKGEKWHDGDHQRLPDAAHFTIDPYCAATKTWTGSLDVPGFERFGPLTMSGIFRLLKALDAQYRYAAAQREKIAQEQPA